MDRQQQFRIADQAVLRRSTGQAFAVVQDDGHTFSTLLHQGSPIRVKPGPIRCGALRHQAAERYVPGRLPEGETLDGHGVGDRPWRVEFQSVLEQAQPDLGPVHRIVTMHDGIYDRLEHGRHVELRTVDAPLLLERGDPHVFCDEPTGLDHLTVQRPGKVRGVQLKNGPRVGSNPVSPICDRLNEGVGQPSLRFLTGHEHTGDSGPPHALLVHLCQVELFQKRLPVVAGAGGSKTLPEVGGEIVHARPRNDLLVESDQASLAALLKQSGEVLRGHPPLGVGHAVQKASGTAVDE